MEITILKKQLAFMQRTGEQINEREAETATLFGNLSFELKRAWWHQQKLVPLGKRLSEDKRCELRQGDFFELARTGFDVSDIERKFDAVLLDIDHSPKHFLDEKNASFYSVEGLKTLSKKLKDGGVFALWSNDPPDEEFRNHLESIFGKASAHRVEFANSYTNSVSVNSVYTAHLDFA